VFIETDLFITPQGRFSCSHPHLFELGSCHHKQYIVNFFFPSLPLEQEYQGISLLSSINLYVSP